MELPINVMVVVLIALVVLIAIFALFSGIWSPSTETLGLETVKSRACSNLVSMGCTVDTKDIAINDFDVDGDGKIGASDSGASCTDSNVGKNPENCDNLYTLCVKKYSIPLGGETRCKQLCGCQT